MCHPTSKDKEHEESFWKLLYASVQLATTMFKMPAEIMLLKSMVTNTQFRIQINYVYEGIRFLKCFLKKHFN